MRAPRYGGISRSTATTSRWQRSRRSPTSRASIGRRSRKRSRRSASIRRNRCHGRCENPRGHMNAVRSLVEVRVPDMGNFKDVAVIDVLVKPGDAVVIDSPLVTLESDKATMDVPSTAVGVVEKLHTNKGGKVNTGDLIVTVRANGSAPAAAPLATVPPATALPSRSAAAPPPTPRGVSRPAAPALPTVPAVDFTQFGPTAIEPLSRIQRISGPRLHASWVNVPHVTQFDLADITELEQVRAGLKDRAQAAGVKLTPLAFILRACVKALQQFPRFNASLDATGANLIVRKFLHLGFAADTPNGLVVPVVRDADRKDVYELARQLAQLSEKARAGKLAPGDMQGGCFTISSLGGIGGTAFTPIINAPEVAILGVSRSSMQPVYQGGSFVPRLMLPLSLSYDHRVIDGAMAVRFTTYLAQTLGDPRGLLEAVL